MVEKRRCGQTGASTFADVNVLPESSTPPAPGPALARSLPPLVVPLLLHGTVWGTGIWFQINQWYMLGPRLAGGWTASQMVADISLTLATYALLFYGNWYGLVPRLLARHRVAAYAGAVVVAILLTAGLRGAAAWWPAIGPMDEMFRRDRTWIPSQSVATGLLVVGVSSGLKVTGDYLRGERNRRELENQKLVMELSLLKAQLNPHFLFNTLNNIYALARRQSDKAPEAVLRLAELLRYALYESEDARVPLSQEITNLHRFIGLHELRLPTPGAVAFEVAGDPGGVLLAPMLLLPLVENAFKHGDLSGPSPVVRVALAAATDRVSFTVRNRLPPADARLPAQPGGVGLGNLRRRLQLLYPNRHQLTVRPDAQDYAVTLVLLTG